MFAMILPALLAAATPAASDTTALDAQVAEVFRPYGEGMDSTAPWDRPIFSADVTALIAHWQRVLPDDEPDRLNDGDWLCQCQDWDAKGFKLLLGSHQTLAKGTVQVKVKIDLGFAEASDLRDARIIFKREGESWRIDEIFAEPFPHGLKHALRQTIAEDEALRASKAK